jgi:hypothetical protein
MTDNNGVKSSCRRPKTNRANYSNLASEKMGRQENLGLVVQIRIKGQSLSSFIYFGARPARHSFANLVGRCRDDVDNAWLKNALSAARVTGFKIDGCVRIGRRLPEM